MSNLLVRTEQGSGQQQIDSGQARGELWMEALSEFQLSKGHGSPGMEVCSSGVANIREPSPDHSAIVTNGRTRVLILPPSNRA